MLKFCCMEGIDMELLKVCIDCTHLYDNESLCITKKKDLKQSSVV